jgi:hypothetical protein
MTTLFVSIGASLLLAALVIAAVIGRAVWTHRGSPQ